MRMHTSSIPLKLPVDTDVSIEHPDGDCERARCKAVMCYFCITPMVMHDTSCVQAHGRSDLMPGRARASNWRATAGSRSTLVHIEESHNGAARREVCWVSWWGNRPCRRAKAFTSTVKVYLERTCRQYSKHVVAERLSSTCPVSIVSRSRQLRTAILASKLSLPETAGDRKAPLGPTSQFMR